MRRVVWFLGVILLFQFACTEKHLIKDKQYRETVKAELAKQKELLDGRNDQIFSVINECATLEEKEAMEFLFAFMPLNDMLDYNGAFYRSNVQIALKARKELSWGRSVPNEIFYHFVLPYRASNENLDTFRISVYDELKQRVAGMNMKEAALEINHWCHEKVTYRGTDGRTFSPLALINTSWGRCGEEAVFTVMAMRTVGIPARQCYTPRWAHTDDNHAWVEVWINGKWYFLGACEPEPELNMGWFAEPVTRAMMVYTVVYGQYSGDETICFSDANKTTINTTSNYAPVKTTFVRVLNKGKNPVNKAKVLFKLYNYGELSTFATKQTNEKGVVSITSGLGDYIAWATDSTSFGFKKVVVEQTDTAEIILNQTPQTAANIQFDIVPPIDHTPRKVDASHREENRKRLKEEDDLRNAYMASFIDSVSAVKVAIELGLDIKRTWNILHKSTGNWKEIVLFLKEGTQVNKDETLDLLEVISDKDLQDVRSFVLLDHLKNSGNVKQDWKKDNYQDYVRYVLNPRVANEMLVPYRLAIQNSFSENQRILFQADPTSLFHWTKEKITLNVNDDFSRIVISPIGVLKSSMSDLFSMNVFFIATCRSLGIPARMNISTADPEYFVRGEWRSVRFNEYKDIVIPKGKLQIATEQKDLDPEYNKHWTLAKYDNGIYKTVGFEENIKISSFKEPIELSIGDYMLVTGTRKNNGTVPCQLEFFKIEENKITSVNAIFRESEEELKVLGEIDLKTKVRILNTNTLKPVSELLNGKESILAWIDPDKEPTKHVMGDLERLKEKFEEWGGNIIILVDEESVNKSFTSQTFNGTPDKCIYVVDTNMDLIKSIEKKNHKLVLPQSPIVLIVDAKGKYYYYSNGYKIGIGEQLIKTLKKLSAE